MILDKLISLLENRGKPRASGDDPKASGSYYFGFL